MNDQDETTPIDVFFGWNDVSTAMWRGRWIFLPLVAAVMAATLLLTPSGDVYRPEAKLILSPAVTVEQVYEVIDALAILEKRTMQATLSELAESQPMLEIALASHPTVAAEDITVVTAIAQEANVVDFSIDGSDPLVLVDVMSSLIEGSSERFTRLYPVFAVEVVTPPTAPELVASSLVANVVLGGVASILLWLTLTISWDRATSVVRSQRAKAG